MILIRDTFKLLGNNLILLRLALKLCWKRAALRLGVTFFSAEMTPFWGLYSVILTSGNMSCPGPVRALGITWSINMMHLAHRQTDRCTINHSGHPSYGEPGTTHSIHAQRPAHRGGCQSPQRVPAVLHLMSKVTALLALLGWGPQVPTLSRGSGSGGRGGVTLQAWTWSQCVSWELQGPIWGTTQVSGQDTAETSSKVFIAQLGLGRIPGKH